MVGTEAAHGWGTGWGGGCWQVTLVLICVSLFQEDSHLGLKHFELTPPPGSAEQLAAVPGGHPRVLGDPLQEVPIHVSVIVGVILLTLLLPEAFPWKE